MTALPEPSEPFEAADLRVSDAELLERVRRGDKQAYGALWARHRRAGLSAARAITTAFDADDLVSEAFVRVLGAIERGNGPTAAFRPYLVTTIRSVAARWGAQPAELTPEEFEAVDPASSDEAFAERFDQSLTVRAFNSLPQRWQEVLWYTEAERLPPRDVAALIGIKPNAVSALAKRAREGLRHAWVQAHIASVPAESECRWSIDRLAASSRKSLSAREQERLDAHLDECDRCPLAAAEMTEASRRLGALILIGFLGAGAATAYGAFLKPAAATAAALAAPKPTLLRNLSIGAGSAVAAGAVAVGVAVAVAGSTPAPDKQAIMSVAQSSAAPQKPVTDAPAAAPAAPSSSPAPPSSAGASSPAAAIPASTPPPVAAAPSGADSHSQPAVGAPSAPAPGPSRSPVQPSPARTPAALTVTSVDTHRGEYFPVISGTGDPGATITVSDGTTSISTAVASTGTFSAPQFAWQGTGASDSLVVTQTPASGSSSHVTESVTLHQPTLVAIALVGAIGGDAGAGVDADADGAVQHTTVGLTTLPLTDSSIAARYSDGAGRLGPWTPNLLQLL